LIFITNHISDSVSEAKPLGVRRQPLGHKEHEGRKREREKERKREREKERKREREKERKREREKERKEEVIL
jgi:hypothetical protein